LSIPDAILFSLTALWFYLAALLYWQDRRWYLGRIIQFTAMGLVSGYLYAVYRVPPAAIFCVTMFVLLAIMPVLYERRALNALAAGRPQRLFRWRLLRRLVGGRGAWALGRLEQAVVMLSANETEGAREAIAPVVGGPWSAGTRARYLTGVVLAAFRMRCFAAAVGLYEDFPAAADAAHADLYFLVGRAYAERRCYDRAVACLGEAERRERRQMRRAGIDRFISHVGVFALMGRLDLLEETLDREPHMLARLPSAFAPYWRGVARLARGEGERADFEFDRTLERVPAGERGAWAEVIDRRRAHAEELAVAADASVHQTRMVWLLLREIRSPRPKPAVFFGRGIGIVTAVLLAVNVVVWALMGIVGSSTDARTLILFGANMPAAYAGSEHWRLISSMFLHIGAVHLLFNGYALYLFGTFIERWCGRREMLVIYVLSGIGGSAASAYLASYNVSAGASGAIFGLLGAAIVLVLRFRDRFPRPVRWLYARSLILIALVELTFGQITSGIDNHAHAGGFAVGLALGLALRRGWFRRLSTVLTPLLLLLILAAGYAAAGNVIRREFTEPRPRMGMFMDNAHRFRLRVPLRWRRLRRADGSLLFADDDVRIALTIQVQPPFLQPWTGEDLADLLQTRRRETLGDAAKWVGAIEAPRAMEVGRYTFYRQMLTRRPSDEEDEIVSDRYYVLAGGSIFEFEFHCGAEMYELYLPVFRQVLASFRPYADYGLSATAPSPTNEQTGECPNLPVRLPLAGAARRSRLLTQARLDPRAAIPAPGHVVAGGEASRFARAEDGEARRHTAGRDEDLVAVADLIGADEKAAVAQVFESPASGRGQFGLAFDRNAGLAQ